MAKDITEKVLNIKINYEDAIKAIAGYKQRIDELKAHEKELQKQLKDGTISQKQYNDEMAATKVVINNYNESMRTINKTIQNQIRQEKEQEGSLKSLRSELSNLTAQYDALSRAEREGAEGKKLQEKINNITTEIKDAEEATQRYYRNVGNYENAIKNTIGTQAPFLAQLMQINENTNGLKDAFRAGATAVKGFGKQLLALLANPIVAILAAISLAIMGVAKAINSSEEASNRWQVVLAPLGRALNAFLSVIQKVAGGILTVVEGGMKFLNWISELMEKVPVVGEYIKDMNDANREAILLEKERQAIEKQSRKDEVQNAKDQLAVAELRQKAKDKENYTAKERLEFVKEANRLEEEQSKRNVELAERRLKAAQIEASWAENNKETNEELARLEADVYNAKKEYFQKTMELQEQTNTLRAEMVTQTKEWNKAELDALRELEDAMLSLITKESEKQRAQIEINYKREIEDLQRKLTEEKNLTITARNAILQTIEAKKKEESIAIKKYDEEQIKIEIEKRAKLIEVQLEGVKEGSVQELQLKLQLLQEQEAAELASTEHTEAMRLAIKAKYDKQYNDLFDKQEKELRNKEMEAMRVRFETQIAEAYGNEQEILRIKMDQKKAELDSLQQLEGESNEAFRLRQLEAQNAYLDSQRDLKNKEVEIEQAKYQAMSQITNAMGGLLEAMGENNKAFAMASKVLALAEIAINTGKAIAAGVAQAQSVPFPGNIAAIATTIATVMSNITSAIKTVKSAKFATGGDVVGAGTGTSDSIPAMLSNGESVMTANATSMFAPLLSTFNQMGGGVPIYGQQAGSQAMGEDMLARAFAKGVANLSPVVSVEEITRVTNRVKVLENLGVGYEGD